MRPRLHDGSSCRRSINGGMGRQVLLAVALTLIGCAAAAAQPTPQPVTPPATAIAPTTAVAVAPTTPVAPSVTLDPADEPSTLVFFNRDIVLLRARVLGRRPAERARNADVALDELTGQ